MLNFKPIPQCQTIHLFVIAKVKVKAAWVLFSPTASSWVGGLDGRNNLVWAMSWKPHSTGISYLGGGVGVQ